MLRRWLVKLACRYLGLTVSAPSKDTDVVQSSAWADLWEVKDLQIVWPRLLQSATWKEDLEPFFKKSLLHTFIRLAHERDPEQVRRLQERALLINEWLERPHVEKGRDEARLDNAFGSGSRERLNQELERANHARR